MERVRIAEVEPASLGADVDCRALSDGLDAAHVAVNHYRIPPGEGFPAGLHAHGDQEEVFVVLDGEATFETLDAAQTVAGEVTVRAGEAIRFAPGEYQSGRNAGDADLAVLALGAPRDSEDVRVPLDCPECGHDYLRPEVSEEGENGDAGVLLVCPDCGAENVPEGCPECGAEMQVALGESGGAPPDSPENDPETVVICPDCGTEAASPFRT